MSIASRINEMTEHLRNDWNSINKLGLEAKKLPDEYKQVEYIESSGTQYIDTGFAPNQNTRTVIDFMPTYSSGSLFIFGSRLGYNNNAYDLYTFSNKFRDDYANTTYGDGSSQSFPKSANKRYLFDKNKNHSYMYEDDVQFYDHTFTEHTIDLNKNLYLFTLNNNGTAHVNMTKMKLYSCKIYDDDTPIRDFVPCYRINDEEVGLYDTINDVFYTNQGTDTFTYGEIQEEIPNKNIKNIAPVLDRFYNQASDKIDLSVNGVVGRTSQNPTLPTVYTRVDYIESSGTQYIDTGVNADNKLNIKYTIEKAVSGSLIFGAIYNNNGSYIRYHAGINSDKYSFFILNNSTFTTINDDTNVKHEFYIKTTDRIISVDGTTYEMSEATATDTGLNFWLFRRNSNATNLMNYSSFKLYSCQMYYENELVRDFIPCYRNSDSEVGLYDLVNDIFYTNAGTGAFTYGTVVTEPSPDYPLEINNLSGDVEYKVRGKNLLDKYNNLFQGTFLTAEGGNDSIASSTMFRCCTKKIDISNLSGDITCSGGYFELFAFYDENNNLISYIQNPTTTIPNGTKNVRVRFSGGDTEIPVSTLQELDLMVENNSTATDYEPYISESFPLSLKSKNLFDKDNANYINSYIGQSNKLNGSSFKAYYIPCKENTVYTISKVIGNYFRFATTEVLPVVGSTVLQKDITHDTSSSITILTTNNSHYLVFNVRNNSDTLTEQEILDSIQIEESSTPTDYEPYYDINLCDISDYKDRIYSQNGEFYLEKNTDKVVLDGSETWVYSATNLVFYSDVIQTPQVVKDGTRFYCNRFNYVSWTTSYENMLNGQGRYQSNGHHRLILKNTAYTITDDFKQWLSTNNTNVYYVLNTLTTTEITQENYPTLYSQLLAIQEFLTKYKINKEFLLDYSSPEIEY